MGDFFLLCDTYTHNTRTRVSKNNTNTHTSAMGKPKGTPRPKKFGNRAPDGRTVSSWRSKTICHPALATVKTAQT